MVGGLHRQSNATGTKYRQDQKEDCVHIVSSMPPNIRKKDYNNSSLPREGMPPSKLDADLWIVEHFRLFDEFWG
jgi:hypothetical protein